MPDLDYDKLDLFEGREVEHTPTRGMNTLFVNGKPSVDKILNHAVDHVYMGANHQVIDYNSAEELEYFNSTISSLLAKGFYVTLDYDAQRHNVMLNALDTIIWRSNRFVPMLSVHIPQVKDHPNLTIKIADEEFKGSNGGVWCMNMDDVPPTKFTAWSEYTDDKAIEYKETS